jgi:hypothetical protein
MRKFLRIRNSTLFLCHLRGELELLCFWEPEEKRGGKSGRRELGTKKDFGDTKVRHIFYQDQLSAH